MIGNQHFQIAGTGSYFPAACLTSAQVDQRMGMSPGWTDRKIGVSNRYECLAPETILTMGRQAIQAAMDDAGLDWSQIDYIIDCSTSKFRPIPNNACHVQQGFGPAAQGIPCIDIQSTCLGSVVALNCANALFASSPHYRHIVIVASEAAVAGVNWKQPQSAALVGDGSGALVLKNTGQPVGPMGFVHQTFSQHLELCMVDGGGHHLPFYKFQEGQLDAYLFHMDGRSVFRVALELLPPMVEGLIRQYSESHKLDRDRLHVIPHQASPKALKLVRHALNFPETHFHVRVEEIGNMAAASIPVMIDHVRRNGVLSTGDPLMLMGTSAGYSQAAMIFQL